MAVSEDLLVSVSKDQDLVTWSTRSKVAPCPGQELLTGPPVVQVCLSRLQLAAPAHSVSLVSPHILVGLDTGAIMVYLNLGRGDLVQQQVTGSTHSTSTTSMLKVLILAMRFNY